MEQGTASEWIALFELVDSVEDCIEHWQNFNRSIWPDEIKRAVTTVYVDRLALLTRLAIRNNLQVPTREKYDKLQYNERVNKSHNMRFNISQILR